MATLRKIEVDGKKYWQVITTKIVGEKCKTIVLKHLGTAERVLETYENYEKLIAERDKNAKNKSKV